MWEGETDKWPVAAADFITEQGELIAIMPEGCQRVAVDLAAAFRANKYSMSSWRLDHPLNPQVSVSSRFDWSMEAFIQRVNFPDKNNNNNKNNKNNSLLVEVIGLVVTTSQSSKDTKGLDETLRILSVKPLPLPLFQTTVAEPSAVDWIFLVDTLNFSFWSDDEKRKCIISYKGKPYSGYWSLCAAINKAVDAGIPITDPKYYSKITLDELKKLLQPDSKDMPEMPLIKERVEVLNETGRIVCEKFAGSFINAVRQANGSAMTLLKLIVDSFPSYRDVATFHGEKVVIYKRAQILIADLWACFEGEGLGSFHDIDKLSMFADYRIPQILLYYGALSYDNSLLKRLAEKELLPNGDPMEVEIRGAEIYAVEQIKEMVRKILNEDNKENSSIVVNSILIDHYLWDLRRAKAEEILAKAIPFHKTRCIYY